MSTSGFRQFFQTDLIWLNLTTETVLSKRKKQSTKPKLFMVRCFHNFSRTIRNFQTFYSKIFIHLWCNIFQSINKRCNNLSDNFASQIFLKCSLLGRCMIFTCINLINDFFNKFGQTRASE
jgi:hypothetical protein